MLFCTTYFSIKKKQQLKSYILLLVRYQKKKKGKKIGRNINEKEKRLNCVNGITAIIFLCHCLDNKRFVWKLLIYGPFRQTLLNKATLISQDSRWGSSRPLTIAIHTSIGWISMNWIWPRPDLWMGLLLTYLSYHWQIETFTLP